MLSERLLLLLLPALCHFCHYDIDIFISGAADISDAAVYIR
jgi:hypothetical protein